MNYSTQTHDTAPLLITRRQACARYSLSLRQLEILLKRGTIPSVRIGARGIRIPVARADESFLSRTTGGTAA